MTVTSIKVAGDFVSTSVASYINFSSSNFEGSLKDGGFTEVQVEKFIQKYSLVHQLPNVPFNGFSAAVFKDNETGRKVIAMRGTEVPVFPTQTWLDLVIADGKIGINGFAANQAVEMFRYYKSLTTNAGEQVTYSLQEQWQMFAMQNSLIVPLVGTVPVLTAGLAAAFVIFQNSLQGDKGAIPAGGGTGPVLSPSEVVDVTGHSLGGHLAMLFARFFPGNTNQVVTLNAPGFFPQGDLALAKIGFPGADGNRITRLEADGDGISEIGTIWPGRTIRIAQENDTGAIAAISSNHSSVNGTDCKNYWRHLASRSSQRCMRRPRYRSCDGRP